ncbi:MAG: ATP-binding cassette domain-containing protein [Methylobacter sp.]|jgi:ABC-type Fe3+/spermidine/putrescine transport system ATPase subunit|nr:ATP-binding cassette domain-containing protein [Methylobacter sp.]
MKSGFELRSVSKKYDGVMALSDISFSIEPGESLAIIGPSGCGKSTMLRLLAGLEAPASGEILLNGSLISKADQILLLPHQRGIAMVFQDLALWPNLSVLDNVLLGLAAQPLSKQEKHRKAIEALTLCKIEALSDRKPEKLSGGQQQRVALARALAAEPDFLFLDEPFSGLDLVTKITLLEEISLLAEKKKITLVLVSHDPIEATTLCRQTVVLNQGRIEESGIMRDLLREPKSQILRVFRENMTGLVW